MVWREAFIELAWRVQGLLTCACCLHSPTAKLSSCTKKENELMKKKEKKKKRKKKKKKRKKRKKEKRKSWIPALKTAEQKRH